MSTSALKKYLHDFYLHNIYYTTAKKNSIVGLYSSFMRSPLAAQWLFKIKVLSPEELSAYFTKPPVYFHLQAILLKKILKDKLRHSSNLKLLEIGVGAYSALSGYLSRYTEQTVDAVDIDPACIESARKHVDLNQVDVRVFHSDLFSNVPVCKYDLIFWNLPTDNQEPNSYLPGLFKGAPDYMDENALLNYCLSY
jgi:2-polyprenyl-3-methyl-5-hydroxy-6-metoxy-1,4-benzoquinol methylase